MLFWTLLVLLIPNTTVNCAITYTNALRLWIMHNAVQSKLQLQNTKRYVSQSEQIHSSMYFHSKIFQGVCKPDGQHL